jgi:hypothetical protein
MTNADTQSKHSGSSYLQSLGQGIRGVSLLLWVASNPKFSSQAIHCHRELMAGVDCSLTCDCPGDRYEHHLRI